jgi:hypothetical protein
VAGVLLVLKSGGINNEKEYNGTRNSSKIL